jgi:acyl-coenzyme A synthetase/AMP-(fatty) acid ligase
LTPRAAPAAGAVTSAVTPSDTLVIMFTSGSTGPPKGVVHSHGNALAAVRSGLAARCIDANTRLYLPMPFFWVGGLGGGVLSALLAGATLVTEEIPRPETTLQLLERERVTLFRGWPDQAEALARRSASVGADLSSLRPGSLEALLPQEQRAAPGARAKLFGMTESFGPYCGYRADTDMPRSAWGSCGKPFDGMQVRIVDFDTGQPIPVGRIGMIQIRGPHTLRGICRHTREQVFTPDGYYSTGDLGHLDEDGFMFYHGRSDDMFKVSGATVYPSEVEQALRTIDGVENAYVAEVSGAVGAVVVSTATVEHLQAAARKRLSTFKVPTLWLRVDSDEDIPRGATGKVDGRRLRALLAEQTQKRTI